MKTLFLALVAALTLSAADVTGTWTGTFTILTEGGGERQQNAHLTLKQEGTTLTGTAGPDAQEQHAISKGRIENGTITFEIENENVVMKFDLKHTDDEIAGSVKREREGQVQNAKLAVKRTK